MALIEARELHKIYTHGDIEVTALNGVSLLIERGDFVAVTGPSGSGKSTLLNILGCLDTPTSGHYLFDGMDVTQLDRDRRAAIRNIKIGFVFQGFSLLPRTSALENVEMPMLYNGISAKKRRQRVLSMLKAVGLEDKGAHHPSQLSGGEQQRVAMARALVNNAPLILADEPTGNLDTKTSTELMELFVHLNRESHIAIIMVTHEHDIAAYSRRVIRVVDGRIISDEVLERS